MLLLKIIMLLLTVCFANCFSFAQQAKNACFENNYQTIPWDVDQGLSIGHITSMLKDKHGFLWIGTNVALNRFDGSRFINYFPVKNKSRAINSGNICNLVLDSIGNVWIGTTMGLSRYDYKADTFSNFSSPVNSDLNLAFIIPFWATHDEVFCIERISQITAYNIYSFKKRIVVNHFDNSIGSQLFMYRYSILDLETNSIWILGKAGVLEVSLNSGKQTHYAPEKYTKSGDYNESNYISAMCYDPERKTIWLNTYDGLVQFGLNHKKFTYFNAFNDISKAPHYWPIPGISLDPQGRVWIAAVEGIYILDPATQAVRQFFSGAKPIKDRLVNFIYCDPDGIVWGANASKPLYQFNPISPIVIRYDVDANKPFSLSHRMVSSIVKAPQGKLWIGTWDGMNIFDPVTGSFKVLREKDLPGFKGKNIIPVVIDTIQRKAWIKAWAPDALFEMDLITSKCKKITINDTTFNQRLSWDIEAEAVQPFQKGILFPIGGEGIFFIKKDSLVAYPEIAVYQFISKMVLADDRFLFLKLPNARKNLTYTYLEGKWRLTPNPLDSIEWTAIFFNKKDQTFWVGDLKEIIHYDKNFHIIRKYSDGFPGVGVLSIQIDDNGYIWFTIRVGKISRLNPGNGKFIALSEKNGFQKQTFRWNHPFLKDDNGDLYFAGGDGIDRVRPSSLKDSYPPSSVYIQSIEINQKSHFTPTGVNYLNGLSLKYVENNINIETGTFDYYSQGSNRIRYKLEGTNADWQYAPNQYTLRFSGLRPGKYKLLIQASNAVNDFTGPEKTLQININPPFWNSWWFYALMGIVGTIGIYTLFRYQLRQKINLLEMRNRISQDLHDEIGASISGINLLSQMASEKLQSNELQEASAYLFKVKTYIQDVIEKLGDMVWIFNPQNDNIEKIQQRLKSFAAPIALTQNIKIHFETDKETETINLTIRERKAVYLISKEALNNIFKYAACSNIYYSLHGKASKWRLMIKDDGKGFSLAESGVGNGLKNMEARANEIGANFKIQSEAGAGTIIIVNF